MLIKTKYIDCASKSVFNTWKLPTSAADTSGDIYWSAVVYIKDTGEVWTHGKLYGGFFSNADNNKVSLTIGGTTKILALDGHVQSYTTLTGSGSTADQAILSTGVVNKWTLKTLGKNAFSNVDYLPADATAVAAEKVVHALAFQYNGKAIHSFDGSVARVLNIIQGDNVFITGDSQGNVTIAADPGSDTVNTAGATNLINKKLFLIGAESQTTSPQTYSNQYVYIGTDNCLYSLGKKVLTEHQAIYNLDLQTQVGEAVTKVTTFDPNAANNSFTLVQGTNVTLTPDATNKKVTISSKDTTYDFYNLVFKQGESIIDTYKPTTSPSKTLKAGTNVTFTGSNNEVLITTQDTRNTTGASDKLATKLFLTGSLTQTDNPQTYTNSKVYIGVDNKLYSDGKVVSTGDHTHNYAGATSPGGPALKVDLNPSGLLDATYGSYGGILQDSNKGPVSGSWSNRIKILHNNSTGYYTELAQAMTGTAGLWHRRNAAGTVSEWTPVIDKANFRTYLDSTYVIRGNDPNVLTNYVRYSIASGLTMNWESGNATPTHVWGAKASDSSKAYVFNGDNIRAFANAVNRAGDTMTGTLKVTEIQATNGNGLVMWNGTTYTYLGMQAGTTYIRSGDTNLYHRRNGTDYKIWDANNDGSGSGLDADLLDGTQLTNIVHYAGSNAHDNTSCSRIIPISNVDLTEGAKYGSIFQWTNITTQSPAQTGSSSNWFNQLYGSTNDRLYFRTRTNGGNWTSWHKIAYITDNVASATRADYPTGFVSKLSSATWGNQDGTFITGWSGPSSADIQFRNNGGRLNVIIDGVFYQDEGRYKVLDTNNYSATLDGRYLLKGSAVNTNNNSSWLSFANDTGGVGGTMGVNDQWRIYGRSTASNSGYLEIATADDASEPIYVRQYTGVFTTLSRTLTLLDANGNTTMPGTATANSYSTAGRYTSSYGSGTWINSVTNAILTANISGYGSVWCAPVKGGRVAMSVYPSSNNNVYLGYASAAQISAGTNSFNKSTYWNADNGVWSSDGYAKNGSSDSYVLLGGGGHATLSGLYGTHNHFERTSVDPNTITTGPRTYESTSTANRPDTNSWHQYTTMGTGDSNFCHQLSYAYAGGTNIYHRTKNNGSWTGWLTILDSGNYAGVLDGRYVKKAGDTMTGKLTIQSSTLNGTYNGLLVGDDCNIGDCNLANTIGLMGVTNNNAGMVKFGKGGYQFGYNGSNHYVSGSGVWTNLNADLLDGLHGNQLVRAIDNVHLTQYNSGTYTRILTFTIPSGSLSSTISFTWYPTECARDVWADFNINIRSNNIMFKGFWFGGQSRTLYCVGNGTTFYVYVQGTKAAYDPYGSIVHKHAYNISSYTYSIAYQDSTPSGTYSATCQTSGYCANADTVDGQHASAFSYKSWWHWSGQSGQPSWLWGGNSENAYYVYNPSNFRVAYATSAGNADTVDGYHSSYFHRNHRTDVSNLNAALTSDTVTFDYNNPTGGPGGRINGFASTHSNYLSSYIVNVHRSHNWYLGWNDSKDSINASWVKIWHSGNLSPVPIGGIILWSGSVASIPSGWALCNGSNGTPDLRNRFVVGAGSTYSPGNTGGLDKVTLSLAEMPSHFHQIGVIVAKWGDNGNNRNFPDFNSTSYPDSDYGGDIARWRTRYQGGSTNYTSAGSSNGRTRGTTTAHENRPPYYALAYIMRIS